MLQRSYMTMCNHIRQVAPLALAILAGCATQAELEPWDGSKADGIVTLARELGGVYRPEFNKERALAQARESCEAWGYQDASELGGIRKFCAFYPAGEDKENPSCARVRYEQRYQCHD